MNISRSIVSKNSCVNWGQEDYLTLIQCSPLFSYEEASKAWNKQWPHWSTFEDETLPFNITFWIQLSQETEKQS